MPLSVLAEALKDRVALDMLYAQPLYLDDLDKYDKRQVNIKETRG